MCSNYKFCIPYYWGTINTKKENKVRYQFIYTLSRTKSADAHLLRSALGHGNPKIHEMIDQHYSHFPHLRCLCLSPWADTMSTFGFTAEDETTVKKSCQKNNSLNLVIIPFYYLHLITVYNLNYHVFETLWNCKLIFKI